MMKSFVRSIGMVAGFLASAAACSNEMPGQWTLSIENPEHRVVTTLKVEFTDTKAPSCLGGEWKVLKVVSAATQDNDFFPTSDPLSYQIENKQVTIGRNEVCDAYLLLKGDFAGTSVRGNYSSFGLGGGAPLGYFHLSQSK